MSSKLKIIILFLIVSLTVFVASKGATMSFLSLFIRGEKIDAVLFSPLKGQITYKGEPAAGAKIRLWIQWKDKKGETEYFTTDEKGYFSIPQKNVTTRSSPLAQIVITQEIYVEYRNEEKLIWTLSKLETHKHGELGGEPIGLTCELSDELDGDINNGVLLGTRCKWDAIKKVGEI